MDSKLINAYQNAMRFTRSHYENFPVISWTLPKELRMHVAVIYQFARQADDLADEGIFTPLARLANLESYEDKLRNCFNGIYENEFWIALHNTQQAFQLSKENFFNLLTAFKQDVIKNRYSNYDELLDYCRNSANPVGRIILELFNVKEDKAIVASDNICTALQITNFLQDVSLDYQKNRIYLPQNELEKFKVDPKIFEQKKNNTNFKLLLQYEVDRTFELFKNGKEILKYLPNSLFLQLKITILGGEAILYKIRKIDYNVLNIRPKISKSDFLKIIVKGIFSNA